MLSAAVAAVAAGDGKVLGAHADRCSPASTSCGGDRAEGRRSAARRAGSLTGRGDGRDRRARDGPSDPPIDEGADNPRVVVLAANDTNATAVLAASPELQVPIAAGQRMRVSDYSVT
jgi:hypothetical protein